MNKGEGEEEEEEMREEKEIQRTRGEAQELKDICGLPVIASNYAFGQCSCGFWNAFLG